MSWIFGIRRTGGLVASSRSILAPAAGFYGTAVLLRRAMYDAGLLSAAAPPHATISVGGLEAGGSGKTPVTAWVLRMLLELGRQPGLLTRGYGRTHGRLVVRHRGQRARPEAIGDEPAMLVASGLDVPVAAFGQRRRGAQALAGLCDALVLDDGFAHRALHRHLDIVVLRAEAPFGDGRLLPWGTLREPPSSLRRADVVWLHRKTQNPPAAVELVQAFCPNALVVCSRSQPTPMVNGRGEPVQPVGARILAASGIAWPKPFTDSLVGLGCQVVASRQFRDHHRFGRRDVHALQRAQRSAAAKAVVVTPKDAIKLAPLWPDLESLWVVGTAVHLDVGEASLIERLKLTVS